LSPKARFGRDAILQMLRDRKMKAGDKIPSERQLAAELGMNHRTVRRALEELVMDGVVEKRPRLGNFVNDVERCTPLAVAVPTYFLKSASQLGAVGLILDGVNSVLDHSQYSLTMLSYRIEYFVEDVLRFVEARGIRGLFLVGASQIRAEDLRAVMDLGVKVVLLTNHPHLAALGVSSFFYDTNMVFSQLLAGIVDRGHEKIVLIRYEVGAGSYVHQIEESCREYGLGAAEEITVILPNSGLNADLRPVEELFACERDFSALIVWDEVIAAKVFQESYKRRLYVPENFSLAACNNNSPDMHPVPLTSPDTPFWRRKLVTMAAEHIMKSFHGGATEGIQMPMGGGVIWRESVAEVKPLESLKPFKPPRRRKQ